MWQCKHCNEELEDSFDTCWKCGTNRDGTVDPAFQPVPDDPDVPDSDTNGSANPYSSPADVSAAASDQAATTALPEEVRRLSAGTSPAVFFMSIACGVAALFIIMQFVAVFQALYLFRDSPLMVMTLIMRVIMLGIWVALAYLLWNYAIALRRVGRNEDSSVYPLFVWQKRVWIAAAVSVAMFVISSILVAVVAFSIF